MPSSATAGQAGRDQLNIRQLGGLGIPGRALVTVMVCRIVERTERKILTPDLWTIREC